MKVQWFLKTVLTVQMGVAVAVAERHGYPISPGCWCETPLPAEVYYPSGPMVPAPAVAPEMYYSSVGSYYEPVPMVPTSTVAPMREREKPKPKPPSDDPEIARKDDDSDEPRVMRREEEDTDEPRIRRR